MSPQRMAHQAYSQAFSTVGKTRQVVMLYDGAIRFLKQAHEAMENNQIEQRFNLLVRASEIMLGLQSCLDFEQGGDVARVLYDFYSSVDSRILQLHRSNDTALCAELIKELKDMRDIWHSIDCEDPSLRERADALAAQTAGDEAAMPLQPQSAQQPSRSAFPMPSDLMA